MDLQFKPDSLEAYIIIWIYLGDFVGYCSIKWCQKSMEEYEKITHPNWYGAASYTFISDDVEFYNHNKQPLDDLTGLTLGDILYFKLHFKNQKNDCSFEIVPY